MRLNSKRVAMVLLLADVALLVTGCQWMRWLRLLSLKKQLAQVERYVQVEDRSGLQLKLLKPVVYADDLSLLIADETLRVTNGDRVTWVWTYEKQYPGENLAGPGAAELSISMGFHDLKFCDMQFPEPFLALMPKPLIIGLLRSVGQAEVDIRHGAVKMKWAGPGPGQKVALPSRSQVTTLLGPPYWITRTNQAQTYLYKYYQKLPKPSPPADRLAWAKFTFIADGEEIASSEGVIGNIAWNMTRVAGEPEPRVTFSLVGTSVEPVAIPLPMALTDDYLGIYKDSAGTLLNLGRDGDVFVMSWAKGTSGGWCIALPEMTNGLFGLPNGLPRASLLSGSAGTVTGLVTQFDKPRTVFAKIASPPLSSPAPVPVDRAVLKACAGRYKASWGNFVTLNLRHDQLFWKNQGIRAELPLYPASDTNFFFKAVDSPLAFVRNEQGEVTKFVLHYNGHEADAVKVTSR